MLFWPYFCWCDEFVLQNYLSGSAPAEDLERALAPLLRTRKRLYFPIKKRSGRFRVTRPMLARLTNDALCGRLSTKALFATYLLMHATRNYEWDPGEEIPVAIDQVFGEWFGGETEREEVRRRLTRIRRWLDEGGPIPFVGNQAVEG